MNALEVAAAGIADQRKSADRIKPNAPHGAGFHTRFAGGTKLGVDFDVVFPNEGLRGACLDTFMVLTGLTDKNLWRLRPNCLDPYSGALGIVFSLVFPRADLHADFTFRTF